MAIKYPVNTFLGASQTKAFTKVQYEKVVEMIDEINALIDGSITTEDLTLTGDLIVGDDADVVGDLTAGTIVSDAGVSGTRLTSGAGTVSAPGVVVGVTDNGFYEVSSTQLGISVGNSLKGGFDTNGAFTDVISEQTTDTGVTIDGALIKDGSFIGKQATATATAAGLTTGALTGTDQFVTVTSAGATDVICLPLDANCPVGTAIRGWVGANGFELRSNATDTTQTINNVTAGTTNEAAIPATTLFRVEKVASLTWVLTATDEVGAVITAIIPDSV